MQAKVLEDHIEQKMDELSIPVYMREGIVNYVTKGYPQKEFFTAILSNQLCEAAIRADMENKTKLYEYAILLHDVLPRACWGSPETVKNWQSSGGLYGVKNDDS